MRLLKKEVSKQFFKFCLIGLETTILYYILFILLFYFLKVHYILAAGIAFAIGVAVGFFFNRMLTFNSQFKSFKYIIKYFSINLFSLGFTLIALKFLVEFLKIYPLVSTILLMPITTLINFFGIKLLVFNNKKW